MQPRSWIGPALIGVALLTYASPRAHACSPRWPPPVQVERPTWPAEAALKLVDEQIEIECEAAPERGYEAEQACRWRARYLYEGASGVAIDGLLMLPRDHEIAGVQLRVDGRAVRVEPELLDLDEPRVELHAEDARRVEVELELELGVRTFAGDRCNWSGARAPPPLCPRVALRGVRRA